VLALEPDLLVLADYGQLVPSALLDVPLGALNLHPSLLPRHRGASPIPATILAGDERTGVTLMLMDAGLDTGPIVAEREISLGGTESAPELEERLADEAGELLDETLPDWIGGGATARPQPAAGATLTPPLRRADGRLDPIRSATELERQVRAYQPWPGSWLETSAGRLTVWQARVAAGEGERGSLVRLGTGIGLATAAGVLELLVVQPAGGRRMSGAQLVRGRPRLVGG
jgi:methionyl-tRNA formyltransferase